MKKIGLLIIALLLGFSVMACMPPDETDDNGEIFEDREWEMYDEGHLVRKPIEIDFWSANSAVDVHGMTMATLVDRFNEYQAETYPNSNIHVNASFQGGYVTQNTKLQAALIGSTNPEVAMIGVSSFALYRDAVVDQREIFTYDELRNIYEGFLQFAMYKHVFVGYPYFAATNAFLVNRDLAEASGLKVPTVDEIVADPDNSIWTWDYLKQLGKAISDNNKDDEGNIQKYGVASQGVALYEGMFTQGQAIYNPTATEINFDNEYGLNALQLWRDLVTSGAMKNPTLDPNHGTQIQGQFYQGNVGLLFSTSAISKQMYDGAQGRFEVDVLPHPKKTHFYSNQSGGGLVVFNNKGTEKTKAAVEFLRWLQADEQSIYFSTNTGYLVTTKSATLHQDWLDYAAINPILDKTIKLMEFGPAEGTKLPLGRAKALADDEFSKYSKSVFYESCTRDLSTVLTECAERIAYILRENS